MQLQYLERILLITKTGNMTEAAEKLYISQPSLSQMVASVEKEIQATIFDRRTWPMKLTPEGECFIRAAKRILATNSSMMEEIHSIQVGGNGRIHIGASIPRCRSIMPHVLTEFRHQYPGVSICFADGKSAEFEQMILSQDIDMAMGNVPSNNPEVLCTQLNSERYYLVANRNSPFAQRLDKIREEAGRPDYRFSLKEAANESFILLSPTRSARIAFQRMALETGITPKVSLEVYNSDIALEYAEQNLGITLLSTTYRNNSPFPYHTPTLSFFAIDSKYSLRDLYLLYDMNCLLHPAKKTMIDLLLDAFAPPSTGNV